MAAMTQE